MNTITTGYQQSRRTPQLRLVELILGNTLTTQIIWTFKTLAKGALSLPSHLMMIDLCLLLNSIKKCCWLTFVLAVSNVMDYLVSRSVTDDEGKVSKFYECVLCRKQAKDRSNMRRHMIRHHAIPINQPCPFSCGKVFKNKLTFNFHVKGKQCLKKKTSSEFEFLTL